MQEHKPGSKPIDPDRDAEDVKSRDMPGHPVGPDHPERPLDKPVTPAP